ncbi:SRPBCC family protein [Radiobacillus kanasensis]|uniref:SRPBCC family protein n=1 Tax=Radiobacillus kanasensis TaxID=2844358 RepID=UPI001E5BC853|nr:SRPBCC family protein [Radiobacillus kanasensis]UFT99328.1 SRPBCC family protein [Radiobacillus kanasensis]
METGKKETISVETTVHVPVEKVWEYWTAPEHIKQWSNASDDWHAPKAENDLRTGGKFLTRMEAKDGSFGFDFTGIYDEVKQHELISYTMEDGRKVEISFIARDNDTKVMETFEAEDTNSMEMQKTGWQSILDNFKKYSESFQTS